MSSVRIDLRRLILVSGATTLLPILAGVLAEIFIDAAFSLVLIAALASIPFAVFFVCRTALAEMERVVQAVAPLPEAEEREERTEGLHHGSQGLQESS